MEWEAGVPDSRCSFVLTPTHFYSQEGGGSDEEAAAAAAADKAAAAADRRKQLKAPDYKPGDVGARPAPRAPPTAEEKAAAAAARAAARAAAAAAPAPAPSLRASTAARTAAAEAARAHAEAHRPRPAPRPASARRLTQADLLADAARTEAANTLDLARLLAREEEVSRRAHAERDAWRGPLLRVRSAVVDGREQVREERERGGGSTRPPFVGASLVMASAHIR